MTIKTFLGQSRTIKYALFLGVLAVFSPFVCNAIYIDFDPPEYATGTLSGQDGWTSVNSNIGIISEVYFNITEPYSAYFLGQTSSAGNRKTFATTTEDFSFWVKPSYPAGVQDENDFRIALEKYPESSPYYWGGVSLQCSSGDNTCETLGLRVYSTCTGYTGDAGSGLLQRIPNGVWTKIKISKNTSTEKLSYTIGENEYPDAITCGAGNSSQSDFYQAFKIVNIYSFNNAKIYIDDIYTYSDDPGVCSEENLEVCLTQEDCAGAYGWWHYNWQTNEMECGEYPSPGVCAESTWSCQYCDYSECVALDGCYWSDNYCYSSEIELVCGTETSVIFCQSEGDCTTAGGYWYNDQCNYNPAPVFTPWDDYYDEFGDYATATDWINSVASSTGGFLENIGSFMSGFQNFFNVDYAYEKGTSFGSAIPIARGYLEIINQSIFAGYPIGEIFIFVLGFYLAIGVFRMIRNLFALIKFW